MDRSIQFCKGEALSLNEHIGRKLEADWEEIRAGLNITPSPVKCSEDQLLQVGHNIFIFNSNWAGEVFQNNFSFLKLSRRIYLCPVAHRPDLDVYYYYLVWDSPFNSPLILGIYSISSYVRETEVFEAYKSLTDLAHNSQTGCNGFENHRSELTTNGSALIRLLKDPSYQENIKWGKPRRGHPEGSIKEHISVLEANLACVQELMSTEEVVKILLLIHAHDTYKGIAEKNVEITHPKSHASLAASRLRELGASGDVVLMCQYHDKPFSDYRKSLKGKSGDQRLIEFLSDPSKCPNPTLLAVFFLIDTMVPGKDLRVADWFVEVLTNSEELAKLMRLDLVRNVYKSLLAYREGG
ncbi:MAG: hypothetical protein NZT61_07410 [Deltaproteobacteria bacterium]|nr:hypothetical protein [Deltaproteobacteria bacterium]